MNKKLSQRFSELNDQLESIETTKKWVSGSNGPV